MKTIMERNAMQILDRQITSLDQPVCTVRFGGEIHQIYLEAHCDRCRFSEPQQLLPTEAAHREWVEVQGTLYFVDTAPTAADRSLVPSGPFKVWVGSLLAWYYPDERSLTIWGLTGIRALRENQDRSAFKHDPNVVATWAGVERALLGAFPKATRVVALATPFPHAQDNESWQEFLTDLGYEVNSADPERSERQVKIVREKP